ncbi:D-serine ammonia-lyase [Halalkalibacter alkalisediminis]|uniref:Probable D-serine dehydratase n=1 Tax=Halalkalibacter alkalisediminis TaxID=935616 RepID=A0ABV6NGI0_9BACI|nr:D-serine ammonia-lyase [Halalkalibacter alkalisediminis]
MEKEIADLITRYPVLKRIMNLEPLLWQNDRLTKTEFPINGIGVELIEEAAQRFKRFEPFLEAAYSELHLTKGQIESPLLELPEMKKKLEQFTKTTIEGSLYLKSDDLLPVAGSIKARGGFHEVFTIAEAIALEHQLLHDKNDSYAKLLLSESRQVFSNYSIAVGSTGNLGLSIGMMSSKLGFRVTVHMSADAKQWKKDLLRQNGVYVIEYQGDYSEAISSGRALCQKQEHCYFIDDEDSLSLFSGYAVAALGLKKQLEEYNIKVDQEHPLFVYLPCGVGGGPGGVTFGLKHVFGDAVHCFFAEPTHSPAMLIGVLTKKHSAISVQDINIDNKTEADGLAVGRPSAFVGKLMEPLLSGVFTIEDEDLFKLLYILQKSEGKFLEPSALAGMMGPALIEDSSYLEKHYIDKKKITHLVWGTGGSLVPKELAQELIDRGSSLVKKNQMY